jgi:hypothetical protein
LSVTGDHKEHTSSVFHFNDRKVFLDALSYAWIQAVDEYLKEVIGQPVDKKVWSFFFLLDQGTIWRGNVSYINLSSASDITDLYSKYGIYVCRSGCRGWKTIYQVTLLYANIGLALNSSKCQRSEGRIEVMSLNTHTTSMDISTKLSAW